MSVAAFTDPRTKLAARQLRNRLATLGLWGTMVIALAGLAWIGIYVTSKGLNALYPGFFFSNPPGSPAAPGGGFANGIIGTIEIVGLAFLFAAPVGVGAAVYVSEFGRGRLAAPVRFVADVLTGVPTIVTGAFVYAVWVVRFGFSGLAGAIALAIVMLPLVIRSSEEALKLVPRELREAGAALGASKARATISIVLPAAAGGITTGLMLAIARAAGETAPLLLTALGNDLFTVTDPTKRMSTLSLQIFNNATTGFRFAQARAWAGALTLIVMVLALTLVARALQSRSEAKMKAPRK